MKCSNCGKELKEGKQFCGHCGHNNDKPTKIAEIICSKCGEQIKEGKKFCAKCGTNVEETLSIKKTNTSMPQSVNAEVKKIEQKATTPINPKKKTMPVFIITLLIIIAGGAVFAGYYINSKGLEAIPFADKLPFLQSAKKIDEKEDEKSETNIIAYDEEKTEEDKTEQDKTEETKTEETKTEETKTEETKISNEIKTSEKVESSEPVKPSEEVAPVETLTETATPVESANAQKESEQPKVPTLEESTAIATTIESPPLEEDQILDNNYIVNNSDTQYISEEYLQNLTKDQLRMARNEIYARHGRLFTSPELQTYFEAKTWYKGTINPDDFKESFLNEFEKKNIELMKKLEDKKA